MLIAIIYTVSTTAWMASTPLKKMYIPQCFIMSGNHGPQRGILDSGDFYFPLRKEDTLFVPKTGILKWRALFGR